MYILYPLEDLDSDLSQIKLHCITESMQVCLRLSYLITSMSTASIHSSVLMVQCLSKNNDVFRLGLAVGIEEEPMIGWKSYLLILDKSYKYIL